MKTLPSIKIRDFQPYSDWVPEENGDKWYIYNGKTWVEGNVPKYLIDCATGRRYFNESEDVIGFKCFLLLIGTPVVHALVTIYTVAVKIFKLVTGAHLWLYKKDEMNYDLPQRFKDAGIDLLKIISTPFVLVGLELASLYGLFSPLNGRKLYATIERARYDHFILAPCFQPSATEHFFGGDVNRQDQF